MIARKLSQVLSQIGHPPPQRTETSYLSFDSTVASPEKFAGLRSHVDIDVREMPRRRLLNLYAEFCEYYELTPWTLGRFDRSLKSAGFQRRRQSTPGRLWVYQLHGSDAACSSVGPKRPSPAIHEPHVMPTSGGPGLG